MRPVSKRLAAALTVFYPPATGRLTAQATCAEMFETSVAVAAPADHVWAVLVDVERVPEWTASMSASSSPASLVVWEVTSLEPGRSFSWRAGGPGFATVGEHCVTSDGPGRTTATLGIRWSGPLAPVADLLFGRVDRRYVTIGAEGLKRRSEARP